ncbi:PadR family transcriptional regulator [Levilactobacillus humaensis]|uniref:PadR family transcriptional regulator n=1 Tax=Levilactobacillus humaensis TaxID=2950375 RepID=UPI0021C2FA42|nr:PadR family transcriptional regulator [Levilactobacillus humaensis]
MYELLILGTLMSQDMSGYKLGQVLESVLVPRRKISNGVMYPILNKLAEAGDIIFVPAKADSRGKRLAQITTQGRQHLHEMLVSPVAIDAKRESLYRFKFKGMAGEPLAVQLQILNEYKAAILTDLEVYQRVYLHLKEKLEHASPDRVSGLAWGIRTLELQIAESETKVKWTNQQLSSLGTAEANGGNQHNE